jgi:poly(3-hydroxybutyrate) depolymerase
MSVLRDTVLIMRWCSLAESGYAALFLAVCSSTAGAVSSVTLPAWACAHPDAIFVGGFETGQIAPPTNPSLGSGGTKGSTTRQVHVTGLGGGTQTYFLYVPTNYTPQHAWPLLLALHGYAPYGYAGLYASNVRDDWGGVAVAGKFIVVAPTADEVTYDNYGQPYGVTWMVPPTAGANDYDLFAAIRADVEAAYNIERTRIYGWGFSAGAHVMHDLAVNTSSSAFNATTIAAYGVSAGDLYGQACSSDSECGLALAALPRKIPLDIHIGTSDPNYPYAQGDHTRFVTKGWSDGQTIFYTAFSGGHEYTATQLGEIWNNLCANAVIP